MLSLFGPALTVLMLMLRMFLYFYLAINILLLAIISDISHANIKSIEVTGLANVRHSWNAFLF